jgi:hypothetical protein
MSMLDFLIDRAGRQLEKKQRERLDEAKDEQRKDFHRQAI